MSYPTRRPDWLRYLRFWKSDVQSEIDAELRFHFDARIAELVALGIDPSAARAQAEEEFGNLGDVRASLREIDGRIAQRRARGEWIDGVRQDVAYGIRSLLRTPAVTATIVVTLALGLGMNAAMFSFLDQVFARAPGGVVRPESIRRLWFVRRFGDGVGVPTFWSGFDYAAYRAVTDAVGDRARTAIYRSPERLRIGAARTRRGRRSSMRARGTSTCLGSNRPSAGSSARMRISSAQTSTSPW